MNNNNMIKDRTSMYDTLNYWTGNIAPKYIDVNNVNMSRIGLFGYINEIMADTTSDVINEMSVLFNEIFFKRAQIPESILAYAAQYRIEDINAKPATMQFLVGIREDILLSNSITDDSGNSYFIIDSNSEIIVEDDFKYMLDYDVKVNIRLINGKYIYSAQYVMDKDNPLSAITSPYLKITKYKMDGLTYLYIVVQGRQIEKTVIEQTIFNEDFLSYVSKDFSYDGVLADFNVYYKGPKDKEFSQIKKLIIDSAPVDDRFCYYQYKDDNTITISFSTLLRHFRPEFNSVLRLEVFTTKGTEANFSYKGGNVRLNPISEKYDYKKVIILAASLSDSVSAEDKFTYEDLKDTVSYYASTSNNIGTTIDLNKYFSKLEKQSKLTFVKKRDDILDRLFTGYMLMKDSNQTIIPANTLDAHITKDMFDGGDENLKRYVIKAGSKFVYEQDSFEVRKVKEFKETDKFRFSNPFAMVINKNPVSISYYMNSLEKEYLTDFTYLNDKSFFQFITNKIKISRDAINDEDSYLFEFTSSPNISEINFEFAETDDAGNVTNDLGKIKIFAILYDENNTPQQYFEAKMVKYDKSEKEMTFQAKLKTDDYITATNKLRILDSLKANGTNIPEIHIEATEMNFSLAIMYKDDELSVPHGFETFIPESKGYLMTNTYGLQEKINLINDMSDIMRSTVIFKLLDRQTLDYGYFVRSIPFTNYSYIKTKESAKEYISNIFLNATNIRESLKLITNNFSIDLKMYNTYGKSKYFYILGDKNNLLDSVDLSIKFVIKLNPTNVHDKSLQYDITRFIKNYIENTNEDNNLYISNLIRELENNFRDIVFIEFKNINQYDNSVQSIEKNFPTHDISRRNDMLYFVPEFINVSKEYVEEGLVEYNIDIEFK